jgi:hypothetical protein
MSLDGTVAQVKARIPNWVGFGLIILAGVVCIIVGAAQGPGALIPFGIAAIASAILAWWSGAKSTPDVNPFKKSWGGTVKEVDGPVWGVVFVLFLVAVIIALFL